MGIGADRKMMKNVGQCFMMLLRESYICNHEIGSDAYRLVTVGLSENGVYSQL